MSALNGVIDGRLTLGRYYFLREFDRQFSTGHNKGQLDNLSDT